MLAVDLRRESLAFLWIRALLGGHAESCTSSAARSDDPKLPPGPIDAVLIANTYHELTAPEPILKALFGSMRSGGRLVVVDRGPRGRRRGARGTAAAIMRSRRRRLNVTSLGRASRPSSGTIDSSIDPRTTTSGGSSCSASREQAAARRLLLDRRLRIEREVELEHIDARLAKEAELPLGGVRRDQATDVRFRDAAFPRHARHLEFGGGR